MSSEQNLEISSISFIIISNMTFKPKFVIRKYLRNTADTINRPHEDYPHRVYRTKECINELVRRIEVALEGVCCIDEQDILYIHSQVMRDCDHKGKWRTCNVRVGRDTPIPYPLVPDAMRNILPVTFTDKQSIIDWYTMFETIHPFQDGNGRVGGIVIAAVHYVLFGTYLVPKQ